MKLYEIDEQINDIMAVIEAAEGELTDELEAQLDSLEMEKEKKIAGVGRLYKNISAETSAIGREIKNLQERKRVAQNKQESIKGFLAGVIGRGNNFSDGAVKIGWRKSKSVSVAPEAVLPDEYVKIKRTPDKTSIKKALELGEKISGCGIVERENIQIK